MTDYPLVQFVSAPEVGATVRYDFNPSRSLYVGAEEFDEGVPEFEGEPGGIGMEPTGRTVTFTHLFAGDRAAMGTAQATLSRELMRATNWLLYQQSATSEPRWIKTYQQTPGRFDRTGDMGGSKARWSLTLSLAADPFWLGARETLPTVTIHNDPAVPTSNIAAPVLNAPTTATTGGTLAAGTYYYVLTATTSAGETTISNRVSRVTTGTTSTVSLSWAAVTNASGYKVYRSTTSGQEKLLATLGAVTSYTDTGTAASTTAFPTTNTTAGKPMSYSLPDIKGDATAPLSFGIGPTTTAVSRYLVSTIGSSKASMAPVVVQSSAMAFYLDGGAADVASTSYSGGSYKAVTFASSPGSLDLRLQVPTGKPPRGRYKILMRLARSDTSSAFDLRLDSKAATGSIVRLSGTSDAAPWATLVDLGEFDLPAYGSGEAPEFVDQASYDNVSLSLSASRVSGAGQLYADYLIAIPVAMENDSASTLKFGQLDDVGFYDLYVDGNQERTTLGLGGLDYLVDATAPALAGAYPRVTPGKPNLMHMLAHVSTAPAAATPMGASNSDVITRATEVRMSYRPRYLWLAAS